MAGKKPGKHQDKRLSAAFVRSVAAPGRYMDGQGLFLKVDATGAKRWGQRLMIKSERVDLGLGGVDLVSLAEARAQALENRRLARAGVDPRAAKLQAKQTVTFSIAVDRYLENKLAAFRSEKHKKQWRATLDAYAVPVIGNKDVGDISVQDVLRAIEPIWSTKTETASRVRGRIEKVLAWATVSGHRSGDNSARWVGNLKEILPAPGKVADKNNHPALALADVQRWYDDAKRREGNSARALQFAALTWARSGEVRGMTWDEVDLSEALWVIPAARMKAKQEHRVPLTKQAIELLKGMERSTSPFVFFAPRGGMLSDTALLAVMRKMHDMVSHDRIAGGGYFDPRTKRPAVPHGLRSTARDWAAEKGYDRDMAEISLAHLVGSEVERAYRRSDMLERRRAMLADWSAFLAGTSTGRVVSIARKRK